MLAKTREGGSDVHMVKDEQDNVDGSEMSGGEESGEESGEEGGESEVDGFPGMDIEDDVDADGGFDDMF